MTTTRPSAVSVTPSPSQPSSVDLFAENVMECLGQGIQLTVATLTHVLDYALSPGVILVRIASCVLFHRLSRRGTELGQLIRAALLLEIVSFGLWHVLPNSLAAILTLYGSFYVYGKLFDRQATAKSNAQIITEADIGDTLKEVSPNLRFELIQDGELFRISTFLQYVVHSREQQHAKVTEQYYCQGIPLSEISTIHSGYDYDVSRVIKSLGVNSKLCFHVTLTDQTTTVTFIARDSETRDQWLSVLHFLCTAVKDVKALWLEKARTRAGVSRDNGTVQLEQLDRIMTAAGRSIDKCYLTELLKVVSSKKSSLTQSKGQQTDNTAEADAIFKAFNVATFRPEIEILFERLLRKNNNDVILDTSVFCQFLREEQHEVDVDINTTKSILRKYETLSPTFKLTTVGFTNYMVSERNSIFNYKCKEVYQDMTQPLNHYFISTSHNTYLTKDQLKSKSSVEMYINALKKGCRCVELDTWDGPNNQPVIYHGRTLTSKILFKDVITAIRDHAFSVSHYPVILSFENHCSVEQQKVMASHLLNILGDKLYTKSIPEDEKQYPSPEDLKGYVIVKYKKLKTGQDLAYDDDDESTDDELSDEEPVNCQSEEENDDADDEDTQKKASIKSIIGVMKGIKNKKGDKKKEEIPKIAQELSDLVIYCQSVRFKGFEVAKEKNQYYEMSSIGEKKATKLLKEDPLSFVEYNIRQMCRTYPAGNRIDSSNYDPHQLWNVGTQMVALNFQTHDRPMRLYDGMFLDNGRCGYVLKPEFLRKVESGFDPRGPFNKYRSLDIMIISGYQLPYTSEKHIRSERCLSVTVRISGVDSDWAKEKTKLVKSNGFHVIWNETLKFKVHVPELALIQFVVKENDIFLGQYTLPIRCMQQGYRNVPLYSKSSTPIPHASLFVNIKFREEWTTY